MLIPRTFPVRQVMAALVVVCAGTGHAQGTTGQMATMPRLGDFASVAVDAAFASSAASAAAPRLWIDARTQQPYPVTRQMFRHLAAAETEGLAPQDYQVQELETALVAAIQKPLSPQEGAQLDARIHQMVLRYLNDLHHGRINPKTIGENYSADARPAFDAEALLAQAVPAGQLEALWQAATPQVPMYAGLRSALQRYLSLRGDTAWVEPLPLPAKGKGIDIGQPWAHLDKLARRLVVLGDLPQEAVLVSTSFDASLQNALKSFQQRHGLSQTGRIDRATVERLNVSPAERAEQIARTMERLRWAPLYQTKRMIVVNIPEYRLRAYTLDEGARVKHVLPINVIVGSAGSRRTPLFNKDMERVEFGPHWNVPPTIARNEMLPRLQRDPDYLRRNNYEIVGPGGAHTQVSPETLAAVASGKARLRQRPGRGNAMGSVKFIFPNKDNIYLHHTASPGLFNRNDRALSHGCVRVENPVALAQFVLQDDPQWPPQRIQQVMDKRISNTVRLKDPIPVIITYLNAVIDEDGKLKFLPDVYGQDRRLKQALALPRAD